MVNGNLMHSVCEYAKCSLYAKAPKDVELFTGAVALNNLPAEWWNWMWRETNGATLETKEALSEVLSELTTVLTCAGITPDIVQTCQLKQAVYKIINHIGTTVTPGTVKASTCSGNIDVANDGVMSVNGLGNVALLNTTYKNITGAITEIDNKYCQQYVDSTTSLTAAYSDIAYVEGINAHCNCINLGLGTASISDTSDFILTSDLAQYALKVTAAGATTSTSKVANATSATYATNAVYAATSTSGLCRNGNENTVCCAYETTYVGHANSAVYVAGGVVQWGVACTLCNKTAGSAMIMSDQCSSAFCGTHGSVAYIGSTTSCRRKLYVW